jgi:SAM-dependent methyltransferase
MTTSDAARAYWDRHGDKPPRATLLRALEGFGGRTGAAVDLGCGIGRDTLPLLRAGWHVLAIDREAQAIARLTERAAAEDLAARLTTRIAAIEDVAIPPCDLVVASFSLFGLGEALPRVWSRLAAALRPGGRFAGQFLGPEDSWAGRPGMAVVDRTRLEAMLAGWRIELCDEERSPAVTPSGEAKLWHLWHVVARRPEA